LESGEQRRFGFGFFFFQKAKKAKAAMLAALQKMPAALPGTKRHIKNHKTTLGTTHPGRF
jgi:hypothetical protein